MTDYAFKFTAQQWRSDPYYVASHAPVHELTVVGSTKAEAVEEAQRVLGKADDYRSWRIRFVSAEDVRLTTREAVLS